MLHYVLDEPDQSIAAWSITRKKFLEMLDCVAQSNLQTVTFEEIVQQKFSLDELKNKIVLTFDDCPVSLFDFAIPELIKRKLKAVFYMPTAYLGKYNVWDVQDHSAFETPLMDAELLKKLVELGMEVGSHSHHHVKLSTLTEKDSFFEITQSKSILQEILHKPVYSIAYPYGEIPKNFKTSLDKAGYHFGLSIYSPHQHRFSLRRIGIYQYDTWKTMNFKMSRSYHLLRNIASPIRQVKKLITTKKRL